MTKPASDQRILTAARRLFFERGFENVSTDLLAREAAVSKATIYRYFDNMADILRAVTEAEAATVRASLPPKTATRDDLRAALVHYGTNLLHFLNDADRINFARLMHEEARSTPEIGRMFFTSSYLAAQTDIAGMLIQAQQSGALSQEATAEEIAEDLLGLWEGLGMKRAQLGMTTTPYTDVDRRVARAVTTILHMHATPPDP